MASVFLVYSFKVCLVICLSFLSFFLALICVSLSPLPCLLFFLLQCPLFYPVSCLIPSLLCLLLLVLCFTSSHFLPLRPPLSFALPGCCRLSCAGVKYGLFGILVYYLTEFERYSMLSSSSCHQKQSELFYKKVVLQILQNSQKNICRSLFFNKVTGLRPATYLKRDFDTSAFQ